ncbi:hypothetical protein R3P38DRAFT_3505224, partial [Favolaschia claudopus]
MRRRRVEAPTGEDEAEGGYSVRHGQAVWRICRECFVYASDAADCRSVVFPNSFSTYTVPIYAPLGAIHFARGRRRRRLHLADIHPHHPPPPLPLPPPPPPPHDQRRRHIPAPPTHRVRKHAVAAHLGRARGMGPWAGARLEGGEGFGWLRGRRCTHADRGRGGGGGGEEGESCAGDFEERIHFIYFDFDPYFDLDRLDFHFDLDL